MRQYRIEAIALKLKGMHHVSGTYLSKIEIGQCYNGSNVDMICFVVLICYGNNNMDHYGPELLNESLGWVCWSTRLGLVIRTMEEQDHDWS